MNAADSTPRIGMWATIRNRRGLVASVEAFDGATEGRLHLVRVEYTDSDGGNASDTVIWEREHGRSLSPPHALPVVESGRPMSPRDFDALVRAARWSALTPFLAPSDPSATANMPISAPFFGAVQVDDFQLVPLLKALQMPRVSLLLADDVGLGKTIEAGLILTELLLRRRVRRVLVLTPASLRLQWQQEMRDKFSLGFDLVDRRETHELQKRLGLDANPWRTFPRIVASYHYLRQPDVLEQFRTTCEAKQNQAGQPAQLPWDLLIVDEAHNLMPANFGEDSDLAKMLRILSPYFEHKLFLTATPHNGHTRCFSGLLEQLDPVRFTRTSEFTEAEKRRIEDVLVRRLKREINALDDAAKRPRRFAERRLVPVPLYFHAKERALSVAVAEFRKAVKQLTRTAKPNEQVAGSFAIEVLNKRLLSCPYTFAESWFRFKAGLDAQEAAEAAEVSAARRAAEEDIDDDLEREGRVRHAARTVGAWLLPLIEKLAPHIAAVDQALAQLGLRPQPEGGVSDPAHDERLDRLKDLCERRLRDNKLWRKDERLILFTEYKTTLDYLERRLRQILKDDSGAIRVLFGGMDPSERNQIKDAFNDPNDPVRVLIATDAASEGLNLQETAHLLLHYEIPWNPSRLEQRNGRLDRHGQARDVEVHHFTSEDDADLKFIAHVVDKVHEIREDLGSMGELFDAAFQRRFLDQEDAEALKRSLDLDIEKARGAASIPVQSTATATGADEQARVAALRQDVDLSPDTLRDTLEIALGLGVGQPRLEGPDARGRMKLRSPIPQRWEALVDETLRLPSKGSVGAMPGLVFDPRHFIQDKGGRPVFRPSKDTVLLHLGHPMFRQALHSFARARFSGAADGASRWTVRLGRVPEGAQALISLTVEELAVNELREPFHHWVRTLRYPVIQDRLGPALPYEPPTHDHPSNTPAQPHHERAAQELWLEVQSDLRDALPSLANDRTKAVQAHLKTLQAGALSEDKKRFQDRIQEVENAMKDNTIKNLEKDLEKYKKEFNQLNMFRSEQEERKIKEMIGGVEEEINRRTNHYKDLSKHLEEEQKRMIEHMLPKRYTLRDQVQVFPVAVEIRLQENPR